MADVMALLAGAIQPAPRPRAWHGGPTPVGAVRGVDATQALWTPAPRRHSIWALALHIAYWNYAVRRGLDGGPRRGFPRSPANWPAVPQQPNAAQWAADVALLKDEHEQLAAVVRQFAPSRLDERPPAGKTWTYGELVAGIAMHDAYHAGQIQLMKRLWRERRQLGRD